MKHYFVLLLFISTLTWAQTYTVDTTPNPKAENNTFVSDPTYILSESTVASLNFLLDSLERKSTAQVAVVMLPSIGNEDIIGFSQSLFKKWGIGQRDKDNGLLILFVLDQRTIRFHTGFGLEGILPDVTCKRIQREFMVPYFKKEDYNTGIIEGVTAISKILTNPQSIDEIYDTSIGSKKLLSVTILGVGVLFGMILIVAFFESWNKDKFTLSKETPRLTIPIGWWLSLYLVIPAIFFLYHNALFISTVDFVIRFYLLLIFYFIERFVRVLWLAHLSINSGKHHELYNYLQRQKGYWKVFSFLFPVPVLAFYFFLMAKAKSYRNKPRHCKNCGTLSEKLNEEQDDIALNTGQQAEEKLKSVDYDVWQCKNCGSVEILSYSNSYTKYVTCTKCTFIASSLFEKRTLTPATYDSTGAGEEEFVCTHCGHHHIIPFVISRLKDSSSSSSGSSGSSSSSFGGGDSGGGGASSSW
jgi:uncharacterized protein